MAEATARRIHNPVQDDTVVFLETAAETDGERTLIEIDVAPGGGNAPHKHLSYDEHFEVLDGVLTVCVGRTQHRLGPGERATAPRGAVHYFRNETSSPVRARVELRPGSAGFEKALQIGYGLARDGRTNSKGIPRNLLHMGLLAEWSDIRVTGPLVVLHPLVGLLAGLARRRGVDTDLTARYVQI